MKKENIVLLVVSVVLIVIFIYSLFFSTPTYTVSFNTDGGSSVASVRVKRNKTVSKPKDPTKEGYEFVSWQVAGVDFDFDYPITEDITLTAKWEEKQKPKTTTTTKKSSKKKSSKKR